MWILFVDFKIFTSNKQFIFADKSYSKLKSTPSGFFCQFWITTQGKIGCIVHRIQTLSWCLSYERLLPLVTFKSSWRNNLRFARAKLEKSIWSPEGSKRIQKSLILKGHLDFDISDKVATSLKFILIV